MRGLLILCMLFWAGLAQAQSDDRGLIVGFLEDQLSEAGRDIRIEGFRGSLSGQAEIDELTIADDEGIWLTLRGAVLDWNQRALLSGRVEIAELTADELIVPRVPQVEGDTDAPEAEATPFRLPELPVSIVIGELGIGRVDLGASIIGEPVVLNLDGTVQLDGGAGAAQAALTRLDDKAGAFTIDGSFDNTTNVLSLDVALEENAGGIVARLADLPGAPSVQATVQGEGPLDAFTADIALATNGVERLGGRVTLGPASFDARIGGDITALFLPDYRDFFGPDVALTALGARNDDGTLVLQDLSLSAAHVALRGQVTIAPNGVPSAFDLSGELADPTGADVLLPVPGQQITVSTAAISAQYDAATGEAWEAAIEATDVEVEGQAQIGSTRLSATGTLAPPDAPPAVTADLTFQMGGLALPDPGLQAAIGSRISGAAAIAWTADSPLRLDNLTLQGTDYALGVEGEAIVVNRTVQVSGRTTAQFTDLSRLQQLTGQPLQGSVTAELNGQGDPLGGVFSGDLLIDGQGLASGIEQVDALINDGVQFQGGADRGPAGLQLDNLRITATGFAAVLDGRVANGNSDVDLQIDLDDIDRVVPGYSGAVSITGQATSQVEGLWTVDLGVAAPYDSTARVAGQLSAENTDVTIDVRVPDLQPIVPDLSGPVTLDGSVTTTDTAQIAIDLTGRGPLGIAADVSGLVGGGETRVELDARLDDVAAFVPQIAGPATLTGTVAERADALWDVDVAATGPYQSTATVQGKVGASGSEADLTVALPNVQPLVPGISGPLRAEATVKDLGNALFDIDLTANGPYDSRATAKGQVGASGTQADVTLAIPSIGPLAPGLSGPVNASANLRDTGNGSYAVDLTGTGPLNSRASAQGTVLGGATDLDLSLQLANINALVPQLTGPVSARGSVQEDPRGYLVQASTTGPGAARAQIDGRVSTDAQQLALDVNGSAPLGLLNRIIAPRTIVGTTNFDLSVNGAPALSSVSGQISTANARLSLPTLQKALNDINIDAQLSGGRVNITAGAAFSDGGQINLTGPIDLSGALNANIRAQLQSVQLVDPTLYETSLSGGLSLTGPLAGGARIAGGLSLGATELRLPETGLSFGGAVPEIRHIGIPGAAQVTRERAGLIKTDANGGAGGNGGGPAFPLDLTIDAPNQIFIRGRGLDAELGGSLRLSGTTANVVPIGGFELLRGRIDLLGKRLTLDQGRITMAGSFTPTLFLQATAVSGGVTAITTVGGAATDPEITFSSVPELPEDEVLARLFFGRGIESLSALQVAQLASAVATLSGQGGGGLLGQLREGIGLDDLDFSTDADGNAAVRAGAYVSENIYTDVTTSSSGEAEVNLKVDLTDTVTITGTAESDGNTSVGIFFERDY
ncbi:translocation/assembly module TamB domain-containing protein [Actibacterium sp. 188UL27-1]|uniref:translocation/assembly module TamB domain-containing protein n=1 Tax=Actibacterium sp. 188UL27-1 TaxID=2786961 RepID=UPI00195D7129|nr:translocation/assembly module TamB domain-containing protein [Actibacterium sp. 188UL27-1]MBM7068724.1 translocation/assembly module TamB domain-containing protein [Actibacterium sp. 188UL27-1]